MITHDNKMKLWFVLSGVTITVITKDSFKRVSGELYFLPSQNIIFQRYFIDNIILY